MKLYATVTSERATKGQGGNKYLIIEIKAEKFDGIPTRANQYRLSLSADPTSNKLYAELLDYSTGKVMILIPRQYDIPCAKCGGKRDVEAIICNNCHPDDIIEPWDIKQEDNKQTKGEKQKGECKHEGGAICIRCADIPLI